MTGPTARAPAGAVSGSVGGSRLIMVLAHAGGLPAGRLSTTSPAPGPVDVNCRSVSRTGPTMENVFARPMPIKEGSEHPHF